MAENAERTIQDMIPEMTEMERIGLFTAEETRYFMACWVDVDCGRMTFTIG